MAKQLTEMSTLELLEKAIKRGSIGSREILLERIKTSGKEFHDYFADEYLARAGSSVELAPPQENNVVQMPARLPNLVTIFEKFKSDQFETRSATLQPLYDSGWNFLDIKDPNISTMRMAPEEAKGFLKKKIEENKTWSEIKVKSLSEANTLKMIMDAYSRVWSLERQAS